MRKSTLFLALPALLLVTSCNAGEPTKSEVEVTDMVGRKVFVKPGTYKKVLCIGSGALRQYSYVGDMKLLCGVEDIDNVSLDVRPTVFDGVARPYLIANEDLLKTLPSCGVGGPQAQAAEAEKILTCAPDIVISQYTDADKENALQEKLGVPVITVALSASSDQTFYDSLELLGTVFLKQERAKTIIDFQKKELETISKRTANIADASKKSTYICGLGNWGTTNQYMTAQNYAPFNTAHIKNVVTGLAKDGIQAIDAEKFAALAPNMEVMVFDVAAVKNIKGKGFDFSACKAFETGEVYLQMAYNAYYTNLEISLINAWFLAKSVYPSLFEDIDIAAKADEVTRVFNGKALYNDIKAKRMSFGGYQKIANPTEFFA